MVKKEINIMKELNHKNIVQYYEDFREKGEWFIVLEYCGKGDMEQYKKKVGKFFTIKAKYLKKCVNCSPTAS